MLSKVNINDSIRVNTQPTKSNKAKDTFKKLVKDASNTKDSPQDVAKPPDNPKEDLGVNNKNEDYNKEDLSTVDNLMLATLIGSNAEPIANQNTAEELATMLVPTKQVSVIGNANVLSKAVSEQPLTTVLAGQGTIDFQNKLANTENGKVTLDTPKSTIIQDLNGESTQKVANQVSEKMVGDSSKLIKNDIQSPAVNAEIAKSADQKPQVDSLATEKIVAVNGTTPESKTESVSNEGKEIAKNNELNLNALLAEKTPKVDIPKVNVKVGESVNVNSNEFAGNIAEKIIYNADGKSNEFEIQLNPKELGKLNIKVVFESGRAEVSLICSNPKTLSLLAENARGICSIIEANTGSQVAINIQENKDFFNEQQKNGYDDKGQNSNQKESDHNNKQQNERSSIDFIQQLRLGLVDTGEEINYYNFVRM